MKALHPADHEIKATRVPGGVDNTVALCIDQIFDYPLEHASTRVILAPCLETPVMIEDSTDGLKYVGEQVYQPPVFGGGGLVGYGSAQSLANHISAQFESLAITSESVTIEFVAPKLASQGTCAACQFPFKPQIVYRDMGKGINAEGDANYAIPYCAFDDFPVKAEMLSGTRAYTGQLIEGCYMPLRLGKFDQKYLNEWFCCGFGQPWNQNVGGSAIPRGTFGGVNYLSDRIGMATGLWRYRPFSNTWGEIYLDDYQAGSVSIRCRFRMTIEGRVYPGSTYASLAEPPPPPDDHALKMYREIAGRLVNAYPASYNDWNTLKKSILTVASKLVGAVSPWLPTVLKGLPFGGAISTLATPMLEGASAWLKNKVGSTDTPAFKSSPGVVPNPGVTPRRRGRSRRRRGSAARSTSSPAKVVVGPGTVLTKKQVKQLTDQLYNS